MSDFRTLRMLVVGLAIATASVAMGANPAAARVSDVEVTVDSAVVTRDGVVTLQGTVTCNEPADAYVEVDVWQQRGSREAEGIGSGLMDCGTTPTAWTFEFSSTSADSFAVGKAGYNSFASAYSDDGGFINFSSIDQPLKLRPAHG